MYIETVDIILVSVCFSNNVWNMRYIGQSIDHSGVPWALRNGRTRVGTRSLP